MARTKGSGFKMKSAAHGGPMRRNFPSAFPKRDVEIIDIDPTTGDVAGSEVFTGKGAYGKGRVAEVKKKRAWEEGTAGTEEERTSKEGVAQETASTKRIKYTGEDAFRRINESNLSIKEKRDAKAKVRAGGSYTV